MEKKQKKRKVGRPSLYTIQLAEKICERIADGEWLHKMGGRDGLPSSKILYDWLNKHEDFRNMYARAREDRTDKLVEEMLSISDDIENDTLYVEGDDKNGKGAKEVCNHEWIARARLKVDTRKWIACKLAPKKYGEKIQQEVTGKDGGEFIINVKLTPDGD